MDHSDDFDDDFFDNAAVDLDQLETQAHHQISFTQGKKAEKPRQTQAYHHTVAKPAVAGPSRKPVKARDPHPINTEPGRTTGGSFGWGENGKHHVGDNSDRFVENVRKREGYWNLSGEGNTRGWDADDNAPEVVLTKDGGYGFQVTAPAVVPAAWPSKPSETHSRVDPIPAVQRVLSRTTSGSSTGATTVVRAVMAPPVAPLQGGGFPQRSLARSVSAGQQPLRPVSRGPGLPTISSQAEFSGSQGGPSSQGSIARRQAIERVQHEDRTAQLLSEVSRLEAELARQHAASVAKKKSGAAMDVDEDGRGRTENDLKELQSALWRARGESETMRRAHKDEQSRHLGEVDKLRAKILDMEVQMRQKEAEAKRAYENIKSQAAFNTLQVHNSVSKQLQTTSSQRPFGGVGSSSQRPQAPPPMRNGSPRGKTAQGDEMLIRSAKSKGKQPAPPPPPRFNQLANAFAQTPTITRAKRQRTDVSPPLVPGASPRPSPTKMSGLHKEVPSSPIDGMGDGFEADFVMMEEEPLPEGDFPPVDQKAELLYHIFNHVTFSALQASLEPAKTDRPLDTVPQMLPTISRIMAYRPNAKRDAQGIYAGACSHILQICADLNATYEELISIIAKALIEILHLIERILRDPDHPGDDNSLTYQDVMAAVYVLELLSSTASLFPALVPTVVAIDQPARLSSLLKSMTTSLFDVENRFLARFYREYRSGVPETGNSIIENNTYLVPPQWRDEVARGIAGTSRSLSWFADGAVPWQGDELADIVLGLTLRQNDVEIVQYGIELIWAASCQKDNFRALIAPSALYSDSSNFQLGEQPVLERIGRFLITPHPAASEQAAHDMDMLLLRALCMLAIADADAVLLIAEKSIIVPALILLLQRESTKVWGIWTGAGDMDLSLSLIRITLSLLHHLILPMPLPHPPTISLPRPNDPVPASHSRYKSTSGPDPEPDPGDPSLPTGINLAHRLHQASQLKEFNGIQHMFVSALGRMSYADLDLDLGGLEGWTDADLRSIQYLSQDILESVVEGPEGDAIYEIYAAPDDDKDGDPEGAGGRDVGMEEEGGEADLDMEAYLEMEVDGMDG